LATPSQPWGFPNFRALAKRQTNSRLPVFVMLPLDTVTRDGVLTNTKALSVGFAVRARSRRATQHCPRASCAACRRPRAPRSAPPLTTPQNPRRR
jgi:hypothetical protein